MSNGIPDLDAIRKSSQRLETVTLQFKLMPKMPDLEDADLAVLTRLINFPIVGLVYRHRFQMVLDLCTTPVNRVLEIGYGAGFLAYVLARESREYLAVDLHENPEKVEGTLKDLGITNVRCKTGDSRSLAWIDDGSVDLVVSVSCLEHIADQDAVHQEIFRVLRAGGQAVHGVPVKNVFTRGFFKILGYDDSIIHPSEPRDVMDAAGRAGLSVDCHKVFPLELGYNFGLYSVTRFRKS